MTDHTDRGLKVARRLAEWGGPIFLASPALDEAGRWDPAGGHNGTGYLLPRNWQQTKADPAVLDRWRPGMAVCLVTGVVVDGLDLDTYKADTELPFRMPTTYGRATTPSGGAHHLIAPLGIASKNNTLPGVDVKTGTADGGGRGFLFLAPTRKASKVTGEVGEYRWEVEPDLEDLMLLGTDGSGAELAALVEESRTPRWTAAGYDGPSFDMLGPRHQERARVYLADELERWRSLLDEAADWDETDHDDKGRRWEVLARDLAWAVARLATTPWCPEFDAERTYVDLLPDVMAADRKCQGKWREDVLLPKAASEPADEPPWVRHPAPEDDFGPVGAEVDTDLFSATPVLSHIRQAARARRVAPLTLLGYVLARICVELPPTVSLPPLVGSRASLNLAFGMVGASGAGKSVTESTCDDLMGGPLPPGVLLGPGSGEGLVESFLIESQQPDPGNSAKTIKVRRVSPNPQRLLYADEVRHLDKVQGRAGSTMAPLLRTALTGGHLITTNATADRRREVPKMSYRLVAVAGIQPDAADALFQYTSEGTPQRWVWLPTDDPGAPSVAPEWPGELGWDAGFSDFEEVALPEAVVVEVDANRLARLRTGAENVDGHWMITKEKVAVLLAALHNTLTVSEEFWALAGEVMAVSDRQRAACWKLYQAQGAREAVARRRAKVHATEVVADERLERAVKLIVTKLRKTPGEWVAWKHFPRDARSSVDREDVVGELEEQAGVQVERSEYHGQPVVRARFDG